MSVKYKLFQEDRCYGDISKRNDAKENKKFVCEDLNMINLVEFINLNGDKTKTYSIEKYIDDDLRWRQLTKNKYGKYIKGDLTTTWYKMNFNEKTISWKETNFRYNDEIIPLYPENATKYYQDMIKKQMNENLANPEIIEALRLEMSKPKGKTLFKMPRKLRKMKK